MAVRPSTNPAPGNAATWRASTTATGSPGGDDRILYSAWRTASFTSGELADPEVSGPSADPDRDGCANAIEYARGTNPKGWDAGAFPGFAIESVDPGGGAQNYGVVRYRYRPAAEDVTLVPQTSTDVTNWSSGGLTPLGLADQGDGTVIESFRANAPAAQDGARFFRVQAVMP